jgi:RTX calcium-binding nonapeptide repeat (4 copies)
MVLCVTGKGHCEAGLTTRSPRPTHTEGAFHETPIILLATIALTLLVASGIALAVNKVGTQGRDFLKGTDGADNLVGKGDSDRIFGLAGKDNLIGGPGKDMVVGGSERRPSGGDKTLVGGTDNDVVLGGNDSDNILGNEGNDYVANEPNRSPDKLFAGEGNDVVGSFNDPASKDVVACGGGFDRVFADGEDTVAPDCEKVADRVSEFGPLGDTIPQSFWDGLPAPWALINTRVSLGTMPGLRA